MALESYNPERSQRELIMAEGIAGPGPEGPPIGPQTSPAQKPWHISPEYDPKKAGGYISKKEGNYNVFFDPATGQETARILEVMGGAEVGGPPPEGPRPPEMKDKEWETSSERGRAIVREILRLETDVPYEKRYLDKTGAGAEHKIYADLSKTNPEIYNEKDVSYLDKLYQDLQCYTRAVRKERNERDRWDPKNAYRNIKKVSEEMAKGESPAVAQPVEKRPSPLPAELLNVLFKKYTENNIDVVEGDMATWFQEARALGLLDRADAIFDSTYRQIDKGNIPADQVEEILGRNTELARRAIDGALRARRINPDVARLQGLAEAYATRTANIFQLKLIDRTYSPIEGEFRFSQGLDEEDDTKTYWQPGHWPKTYEILAKTPKQFRRAVDSFLSAVTGGRLGNSPDELYEHFNNFTQMIGQAATAENMKKELSTELRQELQGHGFIFGGDYSLETYNMRSANQFLMAMALHEGPDRWVRVARSGNGAVGAYLWKFDYDPRVTFLHNPGGSRGQLLNDTVTQHYLHVQIKNILIEEGMGVVLKDYRPDVGYLTDDPELKELSQNFSRIQTALDMGESLDRFTLQDQKDYLTALSYFRTEKESKANLGRIGIHQRKEEFKGLYEGFDDGGAHIANFRKFGKIAQEKLSPELKKSVIIGKIQEMMKEHRIAGRTKEQLFEVVDGWVLNKQLTDKEGRIWEDAYDLSSANFNTALQMVGAMGEKARRGGGVFFIDRNESGHRFVDNMPVYLGEMFVQYAETRAKIQCANLSAEVRTGVVTKARADAIAQFKEKGYQAKIKCSKILFNTDGDVTGFDESQKEEIDFETATDPENPLNKWLSHTYLSYQPENRHQITNPDILRAAKRRRMRLLGQALGPESQEDQHEKLADLRLVLDPTLNRIVSLTDINMPEGMSSQQAEILISDAAVEASNMGHWRIVRELNAKFMSLDGNPFKMRTGYNLEDYSGIARFIIRMRQFVASNPKRFARRYASELANLPLNVSSMPDQWGQTGVLGAIEMFADPVGIMSEQKLAGQFAITKWVEQMRIGNMIYEALVGHVDSEKGFSVEGLFEKPTNNAEMIARIQKNVVTLNQNATDAGKGEQKAERVKGSMEAEEEFMKIALETFDRLWTILKLVRTMESDTRNAQGALDLEKKDILVNGRPDVGILDDLVKDTETGSSKHTEKQFFDAYMDWLINGAGAKDYAFENIWYKKLNDKTILDLNGTMTRREWLFRKMAR